MAATELTERSGIEKIENNRAELEDLAESDLPCDYIAETLLEVVSDA